MISRLETLGLSALLSSAVASTAFAAPPAPTGTPASPVESKPAVDPDATAAMARMGDFLRSLPAFGLRENVTREQVINGDLKVQKSKVAEVTVLRPGRLKYEGRGDDDKHVVVFFDGKTFSVYSPDKKYYSQVDSPGTLAAMIDMAEAKYGLEFPSADFLRTAVEEYALTKDVVAAGDVGKSNVDGADCEHYAFRKKDVDFQVWVENGERPLPRKIVITSRDEPTQPEYVAVMTWNLEPKIDESTFTFKPPEESTQIPFGVTQPEKK